MSCDRIKWMFLGRGPGLLLLPIITHILHASHSHQTSAWHPSSLIPRLMDARSSNSGQLVLCLRVQKEGGGKECLNYLRVLFCSVEEFVLGEETMSVEAAAASQGIRLGKGWSKVLSQAGELAGEILDDGRGVRVSQQERDAIRITSQSGEGLDEGTDFLILFTGQLVQDHGSHHLTEDTEEIPLPVVLAVQSVLLHLLLLHIADQGQDAGTRCSAS